MLDYELLGINGMQEGKQDRPIRTMAICSGKGGVGKTNVSVNLSIALASLGRHVMLMDADLGMANVDVMLGQRTHGHLGHVLDGSHCLEEIICEGPEGISFIPAASGVSRLANLNKQELAGLIYAFSSLTRPIDVFIVDVAAGIGESVAMFSQAVQDVTVVVCDEPASITDAYALIKVLSTEYNVKRFQILANMVTDNHHAQGLYGKIAGVCHRYLDVHLGFLGGIPRDDLLRKAVQKQKPVYTMYPSSPASRKFRELAVRVDKTLWTEPPSGGVEFFIDRIVSQDRREVCQP